MGQALLAAYVEAGHAALELHADRGRFVTEVSACPVASPLARCQAAAGSQVTSLRHEMVTLGEFERHLLLHLDGKHDRRELGDLLADLVAAGVLQAQRDGRPVRDRAEVRPLVAQALDEQLLGLARAALLVA